MKRATALKNSIEAIAIGGFDGMHIGHQHLFSALGEHGGIVVIETGYANLTPERERERFSTHPLFYFPLESIRHLEGEAFIALLRQTFPKLKKIVVGYDFHFGKNRKCSHQTLPHVFDGEVVVVDEVHFRGDSIHSHKIRAKLQLGDIAGANAFLGHNYTLRGRVVKGQGIGAKELVATINMEVEHFLIPKEGVYAALTRIDDEEHYHPSVAFIGHRVTTDGSFAIESHILDAKVQCSKNAAISLVSFIRENARFETLPELKAMIEKDMAKARRELEHVLL